MELVLDLHLHSRFSRAVSQKMTIPNLYLWGRKKGINVLSVTDFTHPVWFREARGSLVEVAEGVYQPRDVEKLEESSGEYFTKQFLGPYFILSTEVSCIYSENGQGRRVHLLLFAPSFEVVAKINEKFLELGFNLASDGRPILGTSARNLAEILYTIDPLIAIIPAHIWTPWFALYGSKSGYDSIEECFGPYSKKIFAVETGLSSDPSMNWRIPDLASRSIVSFSDAHSLEKMGREATVLRKIDQTPIVEKDLTYKNILNAFVRGHERIFEIDSTIEFYPEEGKYHYTGHRNCNVSYSPSETKSKGVLCPACGKGLTVGVLHRVEELATLPDIFSLEKDSQGVVWIIDPKGTRPRSVSVVSLQEIIAQTRNAGVSTAGVVTLYDTLITRFGCEFEILLKTPLDVLSELGGARLAEGIERVRTRNIHIVPGFDGEYGVVEIWNKDQPLEEKKDQLGLVF
jgi:uncharacterized protein (TIGR00375 family)